MYVADKYEGLVVIGDPDPKSKTPGVSTLLDGDPRNNFLKRALAFNPDGVLNGARRIVIAGTYAYMLCDRGLVVVDSNDPLKPSVSAVIGAPECRIRVESLSSSATLSWSTAKASKFSMCLTWAVLASSRTLPFRSKTAQHLRGAHVCLRRRRQTRCSHH